jgi:DNA-binding winged helix-turn-helix (wHTH) protein
MEQETEGQFIFGPYTLEPDQRRLLMGGNQTIELTAKAFDLLVLLVSQAGRLVTKDEILEAVWPGVIIVESNVTATIRMIRKALREDAEHQYIETIPKKGYRFVAPVSKLGPGQAKPETPRIVSAPGKTRRRLWIALSSLVVVICIAIVLKWTGLHRRDAGGEGSQYKSALIHEAEGNDALAIREFEAVPPSDPDFLDARLRGTWLLYEADQDDDAKAFLAPVLNEKVEVGPGPSGRAMKLKVAGLKALLDDRPTEAISLLEQASDANPTNIESLGYIAELAISNGDFNLADKALSECQNLANFDPSCGYERIEALTYEGKFDEAIAEYRRLYQHSQSPWFEQPVAYAELGKNNIPEAQKHFNALAANGRNGSLVHFMSAQDGIAAADLLRGQIGAALRDLEEAENQAASHYEKADYLILMAEIEAFHGNQKRAQGNLQEASRLSDSPKFAIDIACTLAIIGDSAAAHRSLDRNLKGGPHTGLENRAAEAFIEGLDSLRAKDFQSAVEKLALSLRMDDRPETAYYLAEANIGSGNWQAAIESLRFITDNKAKVFIESIASLIPLAELKLSLCYRHLGNGPEAESHKSRAQSYWSQADSEMRTTMAELVK